MKLIDKTNFKHFVEYPFSIKERKKYLILAEAVPHLYTLQRGEMTLMTLILYFRDTMFVYFTTLATTHHILL